MKLSNITVYGTHIPSQCGLPRIGWKKDGYTHTCTCGDQWVVRLVNYSTPRKEWRRA